ncbi:MAG: trigger factor [Thermodesulfobacteriota bacterium]|nr:trigger factor [Thermodesulfobacteriota bacterium]
MQVTVEDQSSVKKTLQIEIPQDEVASELNTTYNNLKKDVQIKGFRPGKAPVSVIKQHYRDKVHADVTMQLIQNSLPQAIKEKDIHVVGEPDIDPSDLSEEAPFTYTATVEVKPDIEDIDYKGIELTKTLYQYSDDEVENQLNTIRQKNFSEVRDIAADRPAREEDIAVIDYEGLHEGQPLEGAEETHDFNLKIGSAAISRDFDDKVKGMSVGDTKTFDIDFPEDHPNKEMAGKKVTFTVTLNALKEEYLPPLDDEFAKKLGPYETLEQVKDEIRKNLQSGYDKRSEQELNEQVFSALLEKHDFEVPESLIRHEQDGIVDEIERTYTAYNLSLENMGQTQEGLREQYRETAVKQTKRHLILNKIIEQENLEISDVEMEDGFVEMATSMQQPPEVIKQFYQSNPEQLDALRYTLLEKKAMKLIMDSGTVTEVEPSEETVSEK